MTTLHIFDLDGTLLPGTSASMEIARLLGCETQLIRLESAFAAGSLTTRGFAAEISSLWGTLTADNVAEAFRCAPWIGGLSDVLTDIRHRGERSAVITMSPDFFANHLITLGVDAVIASRFPEPPLTQPPDPAGILAPADKITAMDRLRRTYGLGRDSCVGYGDSGSDIPLFGTLRRTIAVNGDNALRDLALLRYDGDDLVTAYQMVRAQLGDRGNTAAGGAT